MSRSALQKSELHNKGRTQPTYIGMGGPPPDVVAGLEETREVKSNELRLHGNQTTFNLNTLLANNIYQCDYFRALYQLRTYHEVIDEIYSKVTNVEPWATGTSRLPSTAFCLLFKFFTMRLTIKQLKGLLNHQDSPYIRCIGFLYLRYGCDPKEIWDWFSPYIDDPEEFAPSSDPNVRMTVGEWLVKLLTELQYYGTMLPRIPVPIERKIKMRLVLNEERKKRAAQNRRFLHAFREGARVKAIYEDADNDPAWYTAVISEVVADEENARGEDKYLVTFDGYGNQEVVTLGDLMLPPAPKGDGGDGGGGAASSSRRRSRSRSRSRDRGRSSRSRSRDRGRSRRSRSRSRSRGGYGGGGGGGGDGDSLLGKNLMEAVMKREREAVAAQGKDYAQRPQTYKGSLSLKQDRYTHRRKDSPTRMVPSSSSRADRRSRSRDRDRSPRRERRDRSRSRSRDRPAARKEDTEKMKRLKEIYGDASGKRE